RRPSSCDRSFALRIQALSALLGMDGLPELAAAQADGLRRPALLADGVLTAIRVDLGDGLGDARRAVCLELHGINGRDELAHVVAAALEQHFAGAIAIHVDGADQLRILPCS